MNYIDVVVMPSCCSVLLAELVVEEYAEGVRCRAAFRLQSVSGNICVGYRAAFGYICIGEHGTVVEWNEVACFAGEYKLVVILLSCCVSCSELRNYRLMIYAEMPLIMGRY